MKNYDIKTKAIDYNENDILSMMSDTSQLLGKFSVDKLSSSAIASQSANNLSNSVEFWSWMNRNYSSSGIFQDANSVQQYIKQGSSKEMWVSKQLQGKGYEWDWMIEQRKGLKNIFKRYEAGDIANRAGSDVTKIDILTNKSTEYQMKAYTSSNSPDLSSTTKDMTVVTNSEKIDVVRNSGYESVESFQNKSKISNSTNKRMDEIKSGTAKTSYSFKNVAGTMAKAGLVGCAVGVGLEALSSYKAWKNGDLSDGDYIKEILKSGGDAGLTASITSGVMIPISATITAAGVSTIITIPIAFALGATINKIVAPCFGRGDYKKILFSAKYYQSTLSVYYDLLHTMELASTQYHNFILSVQGQKNLNSALKSVDEKIDSDLNNLLNSI